MHERAHGLDAIYSSTPSSFEQCLPMSSQGILSAAPTCYVHYQREPGYTKSSSPILLRLSKKVKENCKQSRPAVRVYYKEPHPAMVQSSKVRVYYKQSHPADNQFVMARENYKQSRPAVRVYYKQSHPAGIQRLLRNVDRRPIDSSMSRRCATGSASSERRARLLLI